jgi:hypothetical protein
LDIIGVAETFLNSDIYQAEVTTDGYNCYKEDRCQIQEGRGGSVILYVRDVFVSYANNIL